MYMPYTVYNIQCIYIYNYFYICTIYSIISKIIEALPDPPCLFPPCLFVGIHKSMFFSDLGFTSHLNRIPSIAAFRNSWNFPGCGVRGDTKESTATSHGEVFGTGPFLDPLVDCDSKPWLVEGS